jgi:hypothetical protein
MTVTKEEIRDDLDVTAVEVLRGRYTPLGVEFTEGLWTIIGIAVSHYVPPYVSTISVQKGGVLAGTEPKINFIEGTGITIAAVDEPLNSRVNVTITAFGSGGLLLRTNVTPTGTINGVNTVFSTPTDFVHNGVNNEMVYLRGKRVKGGVGNDYVASESGGIGTGYDRITFSVAPKVGDNILIDYYPAP